MKHAATRQLYEYWNALRGERSSPERGEIDPAAIRGVLADTFILELDDERNYRFRLTGTRTNALFTSDLKGRSFTSLWLPQERSEIERMLAGVCDDVVGVVAGVEATFAGRDAMTLELLVLPVRYFGKTHTRILGCLSPGALPRWIGLIPPDHLRLVGLRMLAPTNARGATRNPSGGDRAPSARPRRAGLPVRHGHFLVYDGGLEMHENRKARPEIIAR